MAEAVLGLGANLGARRATFRAAGSLLAALPGCRVLAWSQLYETPPLGPPQPDFLNAAVRVAWDGDASALLAATQGIELALGRERRERWGARTLDIDILHWSEGPVRRARLEVPHPELTMRAFALAPLLDVAPALAPRYGDALARAGGPPPRAVPGLLTRGDDGGYACSLYLDDPVELCAELGTLLAEARATQVEASATRPFKVAGSVAEPARARAWIDEVLADAHAAGFAVRELVITGHDATHVAGVLTGQEEGAPRALSPCEVRIDTDERGARRVCCRALHGGP